MKRCPFCKNEINASSTECPICKMTLVEKVPIKQTTSNSYVPPNTSKEQKYTYTSSKTSNLKNKFQFQNIKNYSWLISIIVLCLITLISNYHGSPNPLPSPIPTTSTGDVKLITIPPDIQPVTYIPPVNTTVPISFYSLPNGTILFSDSYSLSGSGILSISNGSGSDAVVKLITQSGKKIFTVYIRSGNSYSIKNINDNTYRLLFEFGSNWDKNQKKFLINPRAEAFDDTFDFETSDSQYTTYTITLNPVADGTATTNPVDPNLFDQY